MPQAPKHHRPAGQQQRPRDNRQHGAAERGYDWQWTKAKKLTMREMLVEDVDPFCRYCRKVLATMLDHAIPPARVGSVGSVAYNRQFKDKRYLIPACVGCNTRKGQLLPGELKSRYPEMYERMVAVLAKRGVKL